MQAENFGYGIKRTFDGPFGSVVESVRNALKAEGFGVITEIDMKEKFKEKLDKDFSDYLILGACNPPFAFEALEADIDIGLLLPCNVAVYQDEGRTTVSVLDAAKMLSLTGSGEMQTMADEVNTRLKRALESI